MNRKIAIECPKRLIHQFPDGPQRMLPGNPGFKIDIGKKSPRSFVRSTHLCLANQLAK
jgi:hypothetical protein